MIGERIKRLRLQKGISLTELAEKAGVAKSYISSIERNLQKNPYPFSFLKRSQQFYKFQLILYFMMKQQRKLT